ncbi:hypothetical protein NL676_006107 [Syzygium grande]|nr:hypothetical protein NL676_006107 [Syzygium grande]
MGDFHLVTPASAGMPNTVPSAAAAVAVWNAGGWGGGGREKKAPRRPVRRRRRRATRLPRKSGASGPRCGGVWGVEARFFRSFWIAPGAEEGNVWGPRGVFAGPREGSQSLARQPTREAEFLETRKLVGRVHVQVRAGTTISNLQLRGMDLSWQVPKSLQYCQNLQTLDLSNNGFSGVFSATASLLLGLGLRCWYHLRVVRRRKRIYGIRRDNDSVRLRSLGLSYACPGFFVPKADREVPVGDIAVGTTEAPKFGAPFGVLYSGEREVVGLHEHVERFRVNLAIARGLAWLHHECHPPFLHQNLCSYVILIDEDLEARIVDFGLARLMTTAESIESSFVNGNSGEFSYIAPEYSGTMVALMKWDV